MKSGLVLTNSIVTKTGDDGKTFLLGSVRIPKNHIRVKSYGECDELNSYFGLTQSFIENIEIKSILNKIQFQIFEISAILATPIESISNANASKHSLILENSISYLETNINILEPQLPELKNFILPGGSSGSAFLHVTRTICRRVERTIVDLSSIEKIDNKLIIYFNRLSDLLFILARYNILKSNESEIIWKPENK